MSHAQAKLKEKSGTPEEFWEALMNAYTDLFITWDEAVAGYYKYKQEWDASE